jgi:glycosyltransferase involved in cell wall biosynthesis
MIRIAVVYPFLPLYRIGVFKELAKVDQQKYSFSFFADEKEIKGIKNIPFQEAEKNNIKCYHSKIIKFFLKDKFFLIWQKGILRLCFSKDYHAFIFLGDPLHLCTWIFTILARLNNKKVFFWTHGVYGRENRIIKFIRLSFYRLANDLLLYGEGAKKELIRLSYSQNHLHVINNSLDFKTQLAIKDSISNESIVLFKERIFKNTNLPVITFIGRLEKNKRVDLLFDAISKLKQEGYDFNTLIVGDGPEKNNLETQILDLNLNNIFFFGKTYKEEEVALILSSSAIVVSPGNVGLNCIHSLTYGTPVITHDLYELQMPEVESIIPGINGDFYKYGDVNDLVIKIREWLFKKLQDPTLTTKCFEIIKEKYTPKYQKEIIINCLNRYYA